MAKHDWAFAAQLASEGKSCSEIARAMGTHQSQVSLWAKTHDLVLRRQKPGPKPCAKGITPRDEKMAEMYRQGLTLDRIGAHFKLSRERVRQIMKLMGLERAGMEFRAKTTSTKSEAHRKTMEARILTKYGCDIDLWRELVANGTVRRYYYHEHNSRNRAIPFTLTFAQWYAVWQASGKLHLCGRGKGRYCMSRIKDDGAYALGNVHIQLCTVNSQEAVEKWRGREKAIRGVYCLYPGRELAWLAKAGKQRLGFFKTAEEAGAARDAYITANNIRISGAGGGRGWTYDARCTKHPYVAQFCGRRLGCFATQAEAEAAYRAAADVKVKTPTKPKPERAQASNRPSKSDRPSNHRGER